MRHSLRRPSATMVVACLALLVALGGTSYATVLQVPRNSVGPLQLKRNAVGPSKVAPNAIRTGHVLNGSLLSEDFKPGQIPQGPKGDKGDKGPKGDTGPLGISGVQLVFASNGVTNTIFNSVTANCPAGKRALGGGGLSNIVSATEGPYVTRSIPAGSGGTGWTVGTARRTASSWTVTAYAICAIVP